VSEKGIHKKYRKKITEIIASSTLLRAILFLNEQKCVLYYVYSIVYGTLIYYAPYSHVLTLW
jgi:hypothetical protein